MVIGFFRILLGQRFDNHCADERQGDGEEFVSEGSDNVDGKKERGQSRDGPVLLYESPVFFNH